MGVAGVADEEGRIETRLITLGRGDGDPGSPLNVPIYPASNFHGGPGHDGSGYSRDDGTPSWEAFEGLMADLEGGHAVAFSSGMAAIAAVLEGLPTGGKVVVPQDCYTGVGGLLADGAAHGRWQVETVQATDTAAVLAALPGAAMLWLETPSNPQLEVVDIALLAGAAHEAGALVAVDNTFATPLLQNPLALGSDFAIHSATKFIGGHSDLLLGVAVARSEADADRLRRRRVVGGATPGALECFLALRGARTLALRLERAQANAGELARRLVGHPAVLRVTYPGLPEHPQHDIITQQMRGGGAMLSLEVADAATADAVCASVAVVESATSLGGVETLIERRAKLPGQEHVPAGLLRLSVGCEHVEDLWEDLDNALTASSRG